MQRLSTKSLFYTTSISPFFTTRGLLSQQARQYHRLQLKDKSLFKTLAHVNGKWVTAGSGKTFPVFDPSSGQEIGTCPDMSSQDVSSAITDAQSAFTQWKKKTAKERSTLLRNWYELMITNREDLAQILTAECGKPISEARGEINYGASFIEWFAEEAKRLYGDVIPPPLPNRRLLVLKQPIGVASLITPWNFPNAMITRKAGAALAAGCSVVIKPASETPFSALAIAELAVRAGIPPGVVNVVTCSHEHVREVGDELTTNPLVKKISFTGSTGVGKLLMKNASSTIKKVSLELGGNAPFIVFDDADIPAAVDGCIASKFRNTGQTCVCVNRIYVQSKIYPHFAKALAEKVKAMRIGDGFDSRTVQGPLISKKAVVKVKEHVADAVSKGAKVLVGGKPLENLGPNFFEPTVLTDVPETCVIAKEETFGPVAALFKFDTEEQVIELANNTEFGLAGYFYSKDIGRIFRVSEAMEVGMVGVNEGIISTEVAPFGGVKQSGIGREGSKYGCDDYINIKYVCIGNV